MTVAEAQQRVDSQEFTAWQAYDRIEPFGPIRDDLRAATVAATIANAFRGKGQRPFRVADFLLQFEEAPKPTAEQLQAKLLPFVQRHNRAQARRGKGR